MKLRVILASTALLFHVSLIAAFPTAIELTRDNPTSLIGTNSSTYRIFGFRLGMQRKEAEKMLKGSKQLIGETDDYNPSRIYVYRRNADGSKGESLLYLIWEPNKKRLGQITVFNGCSELLTGNFQRLLTSEAVDESPFRNQFIGAPVRSKVTLDIPSIELKNTTYFYDAIGLEVTHVHSSDGDNVVFALIDKPGAR